MRTALPYRPVVAAICFAVALAAPSLAQDANKNAPVVNNDALVVYSAGLEQVLVDPKDQVLVRALRLLDQRLMELPHETQQHDMPAAAMQLVMNLLMGPMQLRAGLLDEMPADGGPPFYAQWNFMTADQQSAEALAGRFVGMLSTMGPMPPNAIQPAPDRPGMQMVNLDGPNAYFGPANLNGTHAFTLAFNKIDSNAVNAQAISPLRGITPAIAASMDFKQLQPLFEMMLAQAGDDAAFARQQMESMGFYGPDAMTVTAGMGYEADRARAVVRFAGLMKALQRMESLPEQRITAADLKRIPADATFAQISKFNFSAFSQAIERSLPQGENAPPNPMDMVEQMTGVHPQRDLFDHLGETIGMYTSDTTGGGGLMSMAAFVEVKNADALNQTLTRVTAMLNQMAQQATRGYVRFSERTVQNQKIHVLSFPGVPIPFELSYAQADGYLFAAASSQSLLAAIDQAKGGAGSLAENPRFKEMGGADLNGAIKMSFIDTPQLIRGGYGLLSMGMTALSNAVRSPTDPDRGADLMMPSLAELSKNAKASLTVTKIEGDDLVVNAQMDRSLLVNMSGLIGTLGGTTGMLALVGMGSGVLLPALGKARSNAKAVKSMTLLRQVSMGVMTYAADENDEIPRSVDVMIEREFFTPEILISPYGPVADEHGDFFLHLRSGTLSQIKHPDRTILGYDRAMFAETGSTAVLFYDGHVEQMDWNQFMELIADPIHEGIDFKLPE